MVMAGVLFVIAEHGIKGHMIDQRPHAGEKCSVQVVVAAGGHQISCVEGKIRCIQAAVAMVLETFGLPWVSLITAKANGVSGRIAVLKVANSLSWRSPLADTDSTGRSTAFPLQSGECHLMDAGLVGVHA